MEQAVRELARFLNVPFEDCLQKMKSYTVLEQAENWKRANPQTAGDVEKWYAEQAGECYLYELVGWNYGSPVYQFFIAPLLHFHDRNILEVGAGIGSLCIALAYAGNKVTYCDISEQLSAFAQQRFQDRGLNIAMVKDLKGLRDFDIVVANDCLEHIHKDRLPQMLKEIAACLKDGGFLYHRSNWGQQDIFPMHFNHSEYFAKLAKDVGLAERANGDLVKGGQSTGVQIGLPILGPMSDEWFYSFLRMDKPSGTKLTKISNRPADEARNEIVRKLEKDWVFFMDADQTFAPEALRRLLSWDLPVVSGLYFKSPGKPLPHVYTYAFNDGHHQYMALVNPIGQYLSKHAEHLPEEAGILPCSREELIEADGIGAGCLLVHKRVFDAIEPPWFQYVGGTNVGEDFYFCRKVRAAGFKIYVDPGVICGHRQKGLIGAGHFLAWITTEGKKLDGVHPHPWGNQ